MGKGRLIVIEGIDGSGKSTQVKLLKQSLDCEIVSFPRYEDNEYGRLIRSYLEGEFGSINEADPYKMAYLFAGDRLLARSQIKTWLEEGKLVIANRYVSASKAHMGANLPEAKRAEFFRWLNELEYEANGLPKEDLTILLKVDPHVAQRNIVNSGPDIHEENLGHLEEANKIYAQLAKQEKNWRTIDCVLDNKMRNPLEIHQELITLL